MKNHNNIKIVISAIVSVYFVFTLLLITSNGLPSSLADYATFGDSFGILNSLFSALGFAGLVYTLLMQQKQMIAQEKEMSEQEKRYNANAYETTLYKLIEMYKIVLSEVVIEHDNTTYIGRYALQHATRTIMDELRTKSTNTYPSDLRNKIHSNNVSESDQLLIDFIHFEHFKIIRAKFAAQGRLIHTTRLLFKHLEENSPPGYDIENARDLVMSQLTHVECQYFFLFSLTNKDYKSFVIALSKTILLDKNRKVRIIEIHRYMFEKTWEINLADGYVRQDPMMDKKKRKEIAVHKQNLKYKVRKLLENDKKKDVKNGHQKRSSLKIEDEKTIGQ